MDEEARRTDELLREVLERLRRLRGDGPTSLVPARVKPERPRNSGAIALPEPD